VGHSESRWHVSILVAAVALALPDWALAQVAEGDQKCIVAINDGARKVAATEAKVTATCVSGFARGLLNETQLNQCLSPGATPKTQSAVEKALSKAADLCGGSPPPFGPPSITAHPPLAVQTAHEVLVDIFGTNLPGVLSQNSIVASCQRTALQIANQCTEARVKEFTKCKKQGMRDGLIFDDTTLEEQCLGTGLEQPDPKGRIESTCEGRLIAKVNSRCVFKTVPLTTAFPTCGQSTVAGVRDCVNEHARCRSCNLINATDGTSRDCDLLDDGDDANSSCAEPTVCGDLLIDGQETCEDGDATAGDGCSSLCQVETGWSCAPGVPSLCAAICGDGLLRGGETCDDGGTSGGDGCSATCQEETGYDCSGQPSSCAATCGDGLILGDEVCDDGDLTDGDGCDGTCEIEHGFACNGEPSVCNPFEVIITSPVHGTFQQTASVNVTGVVTELAPALASLTVNGSSVPVAGDGTFSTVVATPALFNPIRATVTDTINDANAHDRIVLINGPSVADGSFSAQSVGLRLTDQGLDEVEPLVSQLAGAGLNLATLVPVGTILINNECFIDSIFGCVAHATVAVSTPAPSISGFALEADSKVNLVEGDVTVFDISVNVQLSGEFPIPSCPIGITADAAFFDGNYGLSPDSGNPSNIDVNQIGALGVSFTGFETSYGGICDVPIIGDIIQAFIPDVESLTIDAMETFLTDPDGAGPLDGKIADAIETALAGISISGPIGAGLGVMLETPLFAVTEDNNGITLGSNERVTVSIGGGPGQCIPPPEAPSLTASLADNAVFPTFGATTPTLGQPYDLSIAISPEGFNQLLRAQTECGLLVSSINTIDIGFGPLPLTAGLLELLMPEFDAFPAATPFRIDVRPTLAPVVTSALAGPMGELAELQVAQVLATIIADDGSEEIALIGAFDVTMGMDMQFVGSSLGVVLSEPAPGAITVAITYNPLGVDEIDLETNVLPPLVALLVPDLASSLASFPLPEFFGLNLAGIEVSRFGQFLSMWVDLQPAP
jgi:cysteine-rich repeat protein